jgi:hypothetical protein
VIESPGPDGDLKSDRPRGRRDRQELLDQAVRVLAALVTQVPVQLEQYDLSFENGARPATTS